MDDKNKLIGLLNMLIIVAGGIGALLYISNGIQGVATKDFHESDLADKHSVIQEGLDKVRLNTLPPRIRPILEAKEKSCVDGSEFSHEVEVILQNLLQDYKDLSGRAWNTGKCNDGEWSQ